MFNNQSREKYSTDLIKTLIECIYSHIMLAYVLCNLSFDLLVLHCLNYIYPTAGVTITLLHNVETSIFRMSNIEL